MKKRFLRLIEISSGEICPDTGTWYANLKEEINSTSFDFVQKIVQGKQFPELNGSSTNWTCFIEI